MSLLAKVLEEHFKASPHQEADLVIGEDQEGKPITINTKALEGGLHISGLSRWGKTNSTENLLRQQINLNHALAHFDPHGESYERMVRWCAQKGFLPGKGVGRKNIILLEAGSDTHTFGFNPIDFGDINPRLISNCIDYVISGSAQVWGGEDVNTTPRVRKYFGALVSLLQSNRLTLKEIILLHESKGRDVLKYLMQNVKNDVFRVILESMAYEMSPLEFRNLVESTFSRVLEFIKHPYIANILGQVDNVLDWRKIMDEGGIVLVNLHSGLTQESSKFLGTILINDLIHKAWHRPARSSPFYVYIDECHRFLNSDIEVILNELPKRGIRIALAHQNLSHLDEAGAGVRKAVLGIQNRIVFRTERVEDGKDLAERLFKMDLEEPKKSLIRPMQVGYEKIKLKGTNEGIDYNFGSSINEIPVSESVGGNEVSLVDADGNHVSTATSDQRGSNTPLGPATSESQAVTIKKSTSENETLAPVYKDLPTGTFSLPDQIYKKAYELSILLKGQAVVQINGEEARRVFTPLMKDPWASDKMVSNFVNRVNWQHLFIKPLECVEVAQENIKKRLLVEAEKFHNPDEKLGSPLE